MGRLCTFHDAQGDVTGLVASSGTQVVAYT